MGSKISKAMDRSRRESDREPKAPKDRAYGTSASEVQTPRIRPPISPTPEVRPSDSEEYQTLASEVFLALPETDSRVVMFTSAQVGTGTSTVAREFAWTIAERSELRTLLVDGDLRAPDQHRAFSIERSPGLTDHVLGGEPLGSCLHNLSGSRLSVMPAGREAMAPPRVFGDERIKGLIEELRDEYEYIVFDVPAVLSYSEGFTLSRSVDGVLLVVRSGGTKRALVERSIALLEDAGATVLGAVLNRRKFYIPQFVYDRL
ncbi:MAG: polysaccharide biosynthesis tyrosine autokinase [Candidatus Eisenbacteria bacterium]|nr:polysaccharide biosynthesis tyrosine autokinase [Candidatus Eisenbacteria bacterium]